MHLSVISWLWLSVVVCFCGSCSRFPATFGGKPCRAERSCFDSLRAKLSSLSSHGFIHKKGSKTKPLPALRQLSLYSKRGEEGEFLFFIILFIHHSSVPFRRKDDTTCKTLSDFDLLQRVGELGGWRNLTHQRKFDKLTFSVKKSELHFL